MQSQADLFVVRFEAMRAKWNELKAEDEYFSFDEKMESSGVDKELTDSLLEKKSRYYGIESFLLRQVFGILKWRPSAMMKGALFH